MAADMAPSKRIDPVRDQLESGDDAMSETQGSLVSVQMGFLQPINKYLIETDTKAGDTERVKA